MEPATARYAGQKVVSDKGKKGQWSGLRVNENSCEQNGKITEGEHKILFWKEKHYSLREMWRGGCKEIFP